MVKTRNVQGKPSDRRLRHGIAIQLMMECVEEDLSPIQIKTQKDQALHYHKAMEKVREAHQLARTGKAFVTMHDDPRKPVPMPYQPPQKQMAAKSKLVMQPNMTRKQDSVPERSTSPDVIIVGESPPKPKSNAAQPQPQSQNSPARAVPKPQGAVQHIQHQQPISNQTPTSMPAIYQLVTLKNNVGAQRNQVLMKPISAQQLQRYPLQRAPVSPKLIQSVPGMPRLAPPRLAMNPISSTTTMVSGTFGMGVKRPIEDSNKMTFVKKKRVETDESGNWVPLDEYYYGKMEGDPVYSEEKGEYRFKCWSCSKMLYNNTKAMMHIQGHIDSSKQQNIDLSDLTQCKHCYKQFDTPFEMQTHVEKVHMNNVNVLMCRICERDHESRVTLTNHMRQNHNACEMPYICQLCKFRSSMYSDVVDHFKKKHDSSQHMLCLYCLKVFNVKFVSQGWGQTQTYYGHLLKHQSKTSSKKCQLCRLTFFNPQDVKQHRKRDHMPNHKGIGSNARYTTPGQLMIKVPESGLQGKQTVKSLNAPTVSKVLDFGGTRFPAAVNYLHCIECKMVMGTPDHFKKYVECSMCRFATSCSIAYANHMMGFHSGQMSSLNLNIPWEQPMETIMYCLCGFGSRYGNKIANHLVYCTKQSCYKTKQATLTDEGDEEEKDPRHKPGASLLDVLGLVKKRTVTTKDNRHGEEVRRKSSEESQELVWKSSKNMTAPEQEKEEEAAHAEKEYDTPVELKGAKKWSTVKITDSKMPTKASVFLGVSEESMKSASPKKEKLKISEKGDKSEEEPSKESEQSVKLEDNESSERGDKPDTKKESEPKEEIVSETNGEDEEDDDVKKEIEEESNNDNSIKDRQSFESKGDINEESSSNSDELHPDQAGEQGGASEIKAPENIGSSTVNDEQMADGVDESSGNTKPGAEGSECAETKDTTNDRKSAIRQEEDQSMENIEESQSEAGENVMETDAAEDQHVEKEKEMVDSGDVAMETEKNSENLCTEVEPKAEEVEKTIEMPDGDPESQSSIKSQVNMKSQSDSGREDSNTEKNEAEESSKVENFEGLIEDSEQKAIKDVKECAQSESKKGGDTETVKKDTKSPSKEMGAISEKNTVKSRLNSTAVSDAGVDKPDNVDSKVKDGEKSAKRPSSEKDQKETRGSNDKERGRGTNEDRHHSHHGNKQDHHRDRDRYHSDKSHSQHRYNDDRRSHDQYHHGDHRSGDYNRDRHGRSHYDDRNNYRNYGQNNRGYQDNRDNRNDRHQGGYHGNQRGPYRGNWGGRGGRGYGYGGYQGNYR